MKMDRLIAVFILFVLASCGQPSAQFVDINNQAWQAENTLRFTVTADELQTDEFKLFLRHTDTYPYQNIWLKVTCQPQQDSLVEFTRHEIQLAQPDGRWIGKKRGAVYTQEYLLNNFTCPTDTCEILIEQNMRANPLEGVQAVGVGIFN